MGSVAPASAPRLTEAQMHALAAHSIDLMAILGIDARFQYASPSFQRILGYAPEALLGLKVFDLIHPADRPQAIEAFSRGLAERGPLADPPLELRLCHSDGSWRVLEVTSRNFLVDSAIKGILINAHDATLRTQATAALQESEAFFRALWEHAQDLVVILDASYAIRYASPSHQRVLGRTVRELKDRSPFTYMHVDDISLVQARLLILSQTPGAVDTLEIRIQHADGSWRTLEAIGVNRLDDPVIRGIIVNSRDITERVQLEAALQRQALYDGLTGLPNRTLLEDRLRHALLAAKRESHPLALLLLDLDQFKDVNDTLGHQSGDLLLQQIGKRLSAAVRQSDTVARLGGDEFAILLPGTDVAGATLVARSVLSALEPMVLVDDQTLAVSGSIGLAVSPDHGTDEQTLLRHADIAMYTAKRARSGYSVYAAAADNGGADRLALLRGLRKVLAEGGLAMHYQPLVDFTTGRLTSVEALLRWSHAERGHIPPSEIIALAEQTSMIAPLTYWVLEEALRQCQEWQQTHNLQLNMAVNLSVRVLQDPQLLDTIVGLLGRYAIIPSRLTLEITESSLLVEEVQAVAVLRELAVIGVRLAIDDFGTGYASLDYLRRLPVREVKIDRSFVHGLGGSRNLADTAIVRSVIALAKALGLAVVAEGVETQAAWDLLRSLGCDEAQGYFVSRPLAVEDFLPWLQASLQSQPDLLL